MSGMPLLQVEALTVTYALPSQRLFRPGRRFRAVDGASLAIERGESLGLVGETGCGKTSLSRAIYGLVPVSSGTVRFDGADLTVAAGARSRELRRGMQMIFQDPGASLNPRMRVGQAIAEPLEIHGEGTRQSRRERVREVLEAVGLGADDARRYAHELSGGQRQRIAIARAVVIRPTLIIADEPVSALDVSLRAQILNLIATLRRELGLALLFVSHDLSVVSYLCDRVAVMYLGRIAEIGPAAEVLAEPAHPYAQELVASSPVPDPGRPIRLSAPDGEPPNPAAPPAACRYHPRCPHATERCHEEEPDPRDYSPGRRVACHHAEQIAVALDRRKAT